MSRNELIAKIEALNEWETMMEEAKTEADAIRSSIKAEMEERGVEELQAGSYIICSPIRYVHQGLFLMLLQIHLDIHTEEHLNSIIHQRTMLYMVQIQIYPQAMHSFFSC